MDLLPITLVAGEITLIVGACAWILFSWCRHRRFSLRALLSATALVAFTLFVIVYHAIPLASQRLAIRQIRAAGGEITFREELEDNSRQVKVRRVFADTDQQAFVVAQELERLPQFKSVVLSAFVTDAGVQAICETRRPLSLEALHLQSDRISSSGLRHLAKLQRLESLHCVTTTLINVAGITHLKDVPGLKRLCLVDSWKLKGSKPLFSLESFAEIGAIEQLTLLDLRYDGREPLYISDTALSHLHRLKQLKTLWLRQCRVSDEAVADLRGVTRLQDHRFAHRVYGAEAFWREVSSRVRAPEYKLVSDTSHGRRHAVDIADAGCCRARSDTSR